MRLLAHIAPPRGLLVLGRFAVVLRILQIIAGAVMHRVNFESLLVAILRLLIITRAAVGVIIDKLSRKFPFEIVVRRLQLNKKLLLRLRHSLPFTRVRRASDGALGLLTVL